MGATQPIRHSAPSVFGGLAGSGYPLQVLRLLPSALQHPSGLSATIPCACLAAVVGGDGFVTQKQKLSHRKIALIRY